MKTEQEQGHGLYYRSFSINVKAIDEKKRSVDISFSSEDPSKPYSWSNPEVLLHGDENVDLSYLKDLGSVLLNHQPRGPGMPVVIVGKPENVRIEDRIGRATIIFDTDDESEKAFQKVQSGSLRGVSVGAKIRAVTLIESGEEYQGYTGPADLATLWMPVEISLTPIPMDGTVGVNKSMGEFVEALKTDNIDSKNQTTEGSKMTKEEIQALLTEGLATFRASFLPDVVSAVKSQLVEDAKPKMRVDPEQALIITGQAAAVSLECKSMVTDMILGGKNEVECLRTITEQATLKDAPDNTDAGGLPGGTGLDVKATPGAKIISFKQLGDGEVAEDAFTRSLENPLQFNFEG